MAVFDMAVFVLKASNKLLAFLFAAVVAIAFYIGFFIDQNTKYLMEPKEIWMTAKKVKYSKNFRNVAPTGTVS